MKSILLIGQSNMAGRGFIDNVKPIIDERIQVLKNGRWQMMDEPIHSDRTVAGIGPAASFAKLWLDEHPEETIGLIPCADGGTSIDDWAEEQPLTRHAISEAKFAMETSELIGILWHQGESDSMDGKYQDYAPKLSRLIQHFRDRLNVPTVPFVMGLLGDYLGREGFGQSATEFAQINAQIIAVATKQSNCYYVTGEQLLANADGIHINAQSQRLLGMRYFVAFSKERDVTVPLPEEAYAEQLLYKHEYTKNEKMYQLVAEFSQNKISFETFGERMTKLQQT
ncbi:sialate O-acetylesterase [Staphylococcus succinus]|uniref:sialate O-acetylesterase n=1 Tax=Staphylococcus TaxID=1279 RepID=UPI00062BCBBE|nr:MULTISPECIES: sialate O-acetylesterase [Staphylococcus]MDH9161187.1 sialate O-acetylesterase [Staphylococcus succinus]MEB8125006.1 sialate O-acetylesterase [Staphylococcus succinus]OIJ29946.1 acetylxylan esterase [Staphylococcus sp. LCT-H4]PNZ23314.1 sialate O-acetylesterase [Staphylococcus succinus subsp. succinus]